MLYLLYNSFMCREIVLWVYSFMNIWLGSLFRFNQYKHCKILHSATLMKLVDFIPVFFFVAQHLFQLYRCLR